MPSLKMLWKLSFLILLSSHSDLFSSAQNIERPHQHSKRSVETYFEYLESINSLKFKKKDIDSELVSSGLENPGQNSIKIKVWIKKRSHSEEMNVGCSPEAILWSDSDLYLNNQNPVQISWSLIFY